MTYGEFVSKFDSECRRRAGQGSTLRRGQILSNLLSTEDDELSRKLVATSGCDPYYDDDKLTPALAWLAENWKD